MSEDEPSNKKPHRHFYDVDWYRRIHAETQHVRNPFWKIVGRVTTAFGSIHGVYLMMMPPVITFGVVFLIIYGIFLGPLVFLGLVAAGLVGITVLVEKRTGRADNFVSYNFWRRTVAQLVGFSLAAALVLMFLFWGRIPLPHIAP